MQRKVASVEKITENLAKHKHQQKAREHCYFTGQCRGVVHGICNTRFTVPKKISVVFQNGSNFDYHFIIIKVNLNLYGKIQKKTKPSLFQQRKKLQMIKMVMKVL